MKPVRCTRLLLGTLSLVLLLSSCGGGGDEAPATGVTTGETVTLYHPSGRVAATGRYLPGTTTRDGEWAEFFDADGSPKQWQRSFAAGTWDATRPWSEWNADGSVRNDHTDR